MDWMQIIVCLITSGVLTTVINFIANKKERNAKTESVEVSNLVTMVNTLTERINDVESKADEDRDSARKYVSELRCEIVDLRTQVNTLERVTLQAYRCKYPDNIIDSPVVKAY